MATEGNQIHDRLVEAHSIAAPHLPRIEAIIVSLHGNLTISEMFFASALVILSPPLSES
jgi:hypothetical protein